MLVLHRAKLLASNQSVLALGVAPMRVVSRWCRRIVQRLCATDCKRPCLVRTPVPHSATARMPCVYAQGLCKEAKPTKHTQRFTEERGFRQGCRDRTPKGFARTQSPQSVLKGIESLLYFYKNRLFCLLIFYFAYSPCRLSFFVLK